MHFLAQNVHFATCDTLHPNKLNTHTSTRIERTRTHWQMTENALLTMCFKICWANELSQPLFIIIDLLLSLCVCVLGLWLLSGFFFWLHLTSIYLLLASKCSATSHTHTHWDTDTHFLTCFVCTHIHILSLSLSYTHPHTQFFIWIIHYYIRAVLKSRENQRQSERGGVCVRKFLCVCVT